MSFAQRAQVPLPLQADSIYVAFAFWTLTLVQHETKKAHMGISINQLHGIIRRLQYLPASR